MRRRHQRSRSSRRRKGGFTLIEVMVSLGIMTIGAMTMIALQQHTIRSNSHARELTTAMEIAQLWVERLKQDAHTWNNPTTTTAAAAVALQNTNYLKSIAAEARTFVVFPGVAAVPSEGSNVYDFRGTPIPKIVGGDPGLMHYCASYRPTWVFVGRAMRVDVRVWWPRAGTGRQPGTDFQNWCTDDNASLNPNGTFFNDLSYHVVYLSTVIRVQPVLR